MQRYEKRTIPAKEDEFLAEVRCDLCGRSRNPRNSRNWNDARFDIQEVTVKYEHGAGYPEGGSAITQEFDVCDRCWQNKVLPWFTSQGAQVRETESDW